MSVENLNDRYLGLRETLKPKKKLHNACRNVIDQIGMCRDSESDRKVYEAEWKDDASHLRFALEKQLHAQPAGYAQYSLDVYDTLSCDTWIESYAYDAYFQEVKKFEEEGGIVGVKCDEAIPTLLRYLQGGTLFPPEENRVFLEVMAYNQIHGPRGITKMRYLASAVFAGMKNDVIE